MPYCPAFSVFDKILTLWAPSGAPKIVSSAARSDENALRPRLATRPLRMRLSYLVAVSIAAAQARHDVAQSRAPAQAAVSQLGPIVSAAPRETNGRSALQTRLNCSRR